jgi:3-methyladenine DNA glycosylase Tag
MHVDAEAATGGEDTSHESYAESLSKGPKQWTEAKDRSKGLKSKAFKQKIRTALREFPQAICVMCFFHVINTPLSERP